MQGLEALLELVGIGAFVAHGGICGGGREEPLGVPSTWIGRATLPKIWRPREFPKEPQVSYVVRELLGPHEQAYVARDRSDINLCQGQGS